MKYRKKPAEVEARLHDVLYRDHGHSLPPGVQNCRACDRRIQSVMAVLRAFPRRPSQGDATEAFELLHEMNSQGRIGSDDYVALHGLVTGLGEFAPARTEPTDAQVLAAALEINRAGWTYEGAHEPGCLADGCDECAEACLPVARDALKAAFTAGQEEHS